MKDDKVFKVLIDRNLDPEKDLSEDCLVLAVYKNDSRIVLPDTISREARHDLSKTRQGDR